MPESIVEQDAAHGPALDINLRTHIEATRWIAVATTEGEREAALLTLEQLLRIMKQHSPQSPAVALGEILRAECSAEAAPLKRIFVRACVVATLGLRVTDEEEPQRVDIQTDHLIAGTWPSEREAQEEIFVAAGVTHRRTHNIIREIFFRPRAFYEPDEVKRMLGINDRLFDEVSDQVAIGNDGGKVSLHEMMHMVDEVFGMQRIEAALGEDFETFFDPLCRHETVTITAPRYIIEAVRFVTDDFEAADFIDDKDDLKTLESQVPGFTDARNYWETAVAAMRRRIR